MSRVQIPSATPSKIPHKHLLESLFVVFGIAFSEQIPNNACMREPAKWPYEVKKGNSSVRIYKYENKGYAEFKVARYGALRLSTLEMFLLVFHLL